MIALLTGAAVFKAYSDEGCRRKRGGKGCGHATAAGMQGARQLLEA
jgi:hypothetical protein